MFSPKASHGYGGKFGVEKDRVDKVLVLCCVTISIPHEMYEKVFECVCVCYKNNK